jgi:hypothetical protein
LKLIDKEQFSKMMKIALALSLAASATALTDQKIVTTASRATVEFNGQGGRIKVYGTEAGPDAGYVQIKQRALREYNEFNAVVRSFNLDKNYDWAPFENLGSQTASTGGVETTWATYFGSSEEDLIEGSSPRKKQFFARAFVSEVDTDVSQTLLQCPSCATDLATCTDTVTTGCCSSDPGTGNCGGCQGLDAVTGEMVCSEAATTSPPRGIVAPPSYDTGVCVTPGHTRCVDIVSVYADTTSVSMQIAWPFKSTSNTLRYSLALKSRLGGTESVCKNKQRNRKGKWASTTTIDMGVIDTPEVATVMGATGGREVAVTVSNNKDYEEGVGKVSKLYIDFPYFSQHETLVYDDIEIRADPRISPASAVAPVMGALLASAGAFFML